MLSLTPQRPQPLVTPRQAAERLNVGIATVWRRIRSGELQSVKLSAPGQTWGRRIVLLHQTTNP